MKACRCIGNGQAADRSSWRHTHLVVGLAAGVHERRTRTRKRAWSSPQIDSIRTGRSSLQRGWGLSEEEGAPLAQGRSSVHDSVRLRKVQGSPAARPFKLVPRERGSYLAWSPTAG